MTQPQDREAIADEVHDVHEEGKAEAEKQAKDVQGDRDERASAVRRGEIPAQESELEAGALHGFRGTTNESVPEREAGPLDFVTGADGIPIPAKDNDPEMPGAVSEDGPEGTPDKVRQGDRLKHDDDDDDDDDDGEDTVAVGEPVVIEHADGQPSA